VFELLVQEIYNVKSREQPKKDEKTGGARVLIHHDADLDGAKKESTCCWL